MGIYCPFLKLSEISDKISTDLALGFGSGQTGFRSRGRSIQPSDLRLWQKYLVRNCLQENSFMAMLKG